MGRKPSKPQLSIYQYNDFRIYLKDLIQEYAKLHPEETKRSLAQKIGFGSPSFLKMIIDGERTMTTKSFQKLCDYLKIKGREKDYFKTLIEFSQTKDPDQKRQLTDKLNRLKPRLVLSKLKKKQDKYLSQDYFSCIREMVLLKDFKEDPKWIATKCLPKITIAQAREALNTLLELKLLSRDQNGRLVQSDPIVDTDYQTEIIEAFRFHEAVLNKARKYLGTLEQKRRYFSAMTIPIPQSLEPQITQRLSQFQDEILDLINQENMIYEEVFQLNFQFFPVTNHQPKRTKEKEENENENV